MFNRYKLHLPRSVSNASLIGNPQCFDVLKEELLDNKLEDHHGRLEGVVASVVTAVPNERKTCLVAKAITFFNLISFKQLQCE